MTISLLDDSVDAAASHEIMASWPFRKMEEGEAGTPNVHKPPPPGRVDSPVWRNYEARVTDARRLVEKIRTAALLRTMERAP
jgi:hypothetical protein